MNTQDHRAIRENSICKDCIHHYLVNMLGTINYIDNDYLALYCNKFKRFVYTTLECNEFTAKTDTSCKQYKGRI